MSLARVLLFCAALAAGALFWRAAGELAEEVRLLRVQLERTADSLERLEKQLKGG